MTGAVLNGAQPELVIPATFALVSMFTILGASSAVDFAARLLRRRRVARQSMSRQG